MKRNWKLINGRKNLPFVGTNVIVVDFGFVLSGCGSGERKPWVPEAPEPSHGKVNCVPNVVRIKRKRLNYIPRMIDDILQTKEIIR